MSVIDLFISAHEIHVGVILKLRSIAVIPFTVELYEIPVMSVGDNRISFDHQVRDACAVEEHFRAREIDIAVTVLSRKSPERSLLIRQRSCQRHIVNVRMYPVEDLSCRIDIVVALERLIDVFRDVVYVL